MKKEKRRKNMTKAIYVGSFDPFTWGHWDILTIASKLFDEVHLVFAINSQKTRSYDANEQAAALKNYCLECRITNVIITVTDQLLVDYAKQNDIQYIVRGVRNPTDYEYETNIANINKMLYPECQLIFIQSNYPNISSSFVKEMIRYNKDWKQYVPKPIADIIEEELKTIEIIRSITDDLFTHN